MIVLVTFQDIARRIKLINSCAWLVKVCVVVTTRHIICLDTDGEVEFFRTPVDNTKAFYNKLWMLYNAMLRFDYYNLGKVRFQYTKRYSLKLFELWKKANEIKSSKLSLKQESVSFRFC